MLKYVCLSLFVLIFLLLVAINLPIVHKLITSKANSIFVDKGWPVHIGGFSLLLNGEIGLSQVEIIPSPGDTILYAGSLHVSVSPGALLHKQLIVKNIVLQHIVLNLLVDSATGDLEIARLFASPSPKAKDTTQKKPSAWDIGLQQVSLRDIRFRFIDPRHGIGIQEALYKAEIVTDTFSLRRNKIDLASLKLEKVKGSVTISEAVKDTTAETASSPSPWKFSARSLLLTDISQNLDQPDSRQTMKFTLLNGNFSVSKVDLSTQTIIVPFLKLLDPSVEVINAGQSQTSATENNEKIQGLPVSPWTIACDAADIKNGKFLLTDINTKNTDPLQQWFPVQGLTTTIEHLKLSPKGSGFNISNLLCSFGSQASLKSGTISCELDSLQNGHITADLRAMLNPEKNKWFARNDDIRLNAEVTGSPEKISIKTCTLNSPSGIELQLSGNITRPMNLSEAVMDLDFETNPVSRQQLGELITLFSPGLQLPEFSACTFSGNVKNTLAHPAFNLAVVSTTGKINLAGDANLKQKTGQAEAVFSQVRLGEITQNADIGPVTGRVNLEGNWSTLTNPLAEGTLFIDSVTYRNVTTHNIGSEISVADRQCRFTVSALDTALKCMLNGTFAWQGSTYNGQIAGNFDVDAGLMKLLPLPLAAQGNINAGVFKSEDSLQSEVSLYKLLIRNGSMKSGLDSTTLELQMADNHFETRLNTDFMHAGFESQSSFSKLKEAISSIRFEDIFSLDSAQTINMQALSGFPTFSLEAGARYDSIFTLFVPDTVFNFGKFDLLMDKKSSDSLAQARLSVDRMLYRQFNAFGIGTSLKSGTDKLDGIAAIDSIQMGKVVIGKSSLDLNYRTGNVLGNLHVSNQAGVPIYNAGVQLLKQNDQIIVQSTQPDWTLNAKTWSINPPEFLRWKPSVGDLYANLHLKHDSMAINLTGRKTDQLKLDIQNVQLNMLASSSLIKDMPDGLLNAKVMYSDNNLKNLDLDVNIANLKWNNLLIEKFNADGKLQADTSGILQTDFVVRLNDSSTIKATFGPSPGKTSKELKSTFDNIQIRLMEPFLAEYANRMQGTVSGIITLGIENSKSEIDGEISIKEAALSVVPLRSRFYIPDDTLMIKQNQLFFKNFRVLDSLQKQSFVDGDINFQDPENISVNIHASLDKLQVMNTTVKDNPSFFGSIVVNSGVDITGAVKSPSIKGRITLESGTNLTYRQVQDLSVKETEKAITFARLDGNRLQLIDNKKDQVRISQMPSVQTTIEINPKSIFNVEVAGMYNIGVHISGGGLLDYSIQSNNTISLTGQYEIQSGTSELKITGWPKKDFIITPGSNLQWNGNINDPTLNLEAKTRVKGAYLNPVDNKNRNVDFFVSMKLTNRLSQLKIQFDVNSPDQYISTVLNSLSDDEMMKQAVNLLLFESIQLPGIESSSNYLATQMDSFWESQLNAMTKTSIKNVDLSFGIDTYTQSTATGAQDKTSFTYEMERKLLKDKASVKVSGRLNDDNPEGQQVNSIIENFTFEYSLDTMGIKYLKLYRHQDYQDILEGQVTKSGVGFIYRKNYPSLKDIWQRKSKKPKPPATPQ